MRRSSHMRKIGVMGRPSPIKTRWIPSCSKEKWQRPHMQLWNPPRPQHTHRHTHINTKSQAVKDPAGNIVVKVVLSFKANDIEKAVQSLDDKGMDLLMKYIYIGFESPLDNSSLCYCSGMKRSGVHCVCLDCKENRVVWRELDYPHGVGVAGTKTKTSKWHRCYSGSICFARLCLLASFSYL